MHLYVYWKNNLNLNFLESSFIFVIFIFTLRNPLSWFLGSRAKRLLPTPSSSSSSSSSTPAPISPLKKQFKLIYYNCKITKFSNYNCKIASFSNYNSIKKLSFAPMSPLRTNSTKSIAIVKKIVKEQFNLTNYNCKITHLVIQIVKWQILVELQSAL